MFRIRALLVILVGSFLLFSATATAEDVERPRPADRFPVAQILPSLQQELESGLEARRPEEFAFIARVVALVNGGQLRFFLVKLTFKWARTEHPEYPFPYFENALKKLAADEGVII